MSYNVLRQFVGAGGGWGVGAVDVRGWGGGVVQNRESPDFRSPEVGRYVYVSNNGDRDGFLIVPQYIIIV